MRKLLALLATTAALTAALLPLPAGAEGPAPVWVGESCTANAVGPSQTRFVSGPGSSGLSVVPGGPGVITGWLSRLGPGMASTRQELIVYSPGVNMVVGQSRPETLIAGTNTFETRIPVAEGERVGIWGVRGTVVCEPGEGAPVQARVERDHDGDGYGDETQDRCYGERSRDSDCPIGVRIGPADVSESAIAIRVTPEARARVELRGQVLWREDGRLVAGADLSERTKRLRGGKGGTFTVPIPGEVRQRLDRMAPGASLTAKLEFFVTDRDGFESERSRRVALWGRR